MALKNGDQVIVELDYSRAAEMQPHWVVLTAKEGADYVMVDPWPVLDVENPSLIQRFGFTSSDPAVVITGVVFLHRQSTAAENITVAAFKSGTIVSDTLNLRAAPYEQLLAELKQGTRVKVSGELVTAANGSVWVPVMVQGYVCIKEPGVQAYIKPD
jgi:hypothetical protein